MGLVNSSQRHHRGGGEVAPTETEQFLFRVYVVAMGWVQR